MLTEIKEAQNWENKIDVLVKYCPDEIRKNLSVENHKILLRMSYQRLLAAQKYDVENLKPITTKIVLLKPVLSSYGSDVEDYGLSRVTSGKIDVHVVPGNHVTMLYEEKTAEIINQYLTEASDN